MVQHSTLTRIAGIAEDQWGLVTRLQLEEAGIPRTTLDRLTGSGSTLERVARGVYQLAGTPEPNHLQLRAAWLQLAPGIPAWQRTPDQGVVSHRSAAAMYGIGDLPADHHDFTVKSRKQTRRPDVRLHRRSLGECSWILLQGIPVTRPSRIASDLLYDNEEPGAVAHIIADALRSTYDYPGTIVEGLAPHATKLGLPRGDGMGLLRWLLDLVDEPATGRWMKEAQAHTDRRTESPAPAVRPRLSGAPSP